jgi:hypothetical protein
MRAWRIDARDPQNALWQWVGWRRRRASGVARLEIERGAVDAIPEAGGLGRAVREDVAEVGLAAGAAYLRAAHEERAILVLADGAASAGLSKLGQPVPESNLASEANSGSPQHTHM